MFAAKYNVDIPVPMSRLAPSAGLLERTPGAALRTPLLLSKMSEEHFIQPAIGAAMGRKCQHC